MMKRMIIQIDEDLCDGCGLCVEACEEGAVVVVEGKAKLVSESHCDGLGNCLPVCPQGAISFIERDVSPFVSPKKKKDEYKAHGHDQGHDHGQHHGETLACGCSADSVRALKGHHRIADKISHAEKGLLSQWPVQLKLLPPQADFFEGADLLVAADCTAFAYKNFHRDFIAGRITCVGCPKLDQTDYSEKLGAIMKENNIQSVKLARMSVPCCGGLLKMVKKAIALSKKEIPLSVDVINAEGEIIEKS